MNYKSLIRIALITAPLMGATIATPIFLFTGLNLWYLPLVILMLTIICLVCWSLNIYAQTLFGHLPKRNIYAWLFSCSVLLIVSSIVALFITPPFPIALYQAHTIRCINIVSINTVILVIINLVLLTDEKRKLDIENHELSILNLESQLKQLKNQLNPHFLFNALGTLKSLIKREPIVAQEYLVKLSEFLRLCIDNQRDWVVLKEELSLCSNYIDLQKMRFKEALQIEYNIDKTAWEQYKIPFFSIQILLENAIKHNSLTIEQPLKINLQLDKNNLIVSNNIQPKFVLEQSTKTGLNNLKERYKLLANKDITIENNHFIFSVSLPLIEL